MAAINVVYRGSGIAVQANDLFTIQCPARRVLRQSPVPTAVAGEAVLHTGHSSVIDEMSNAIGSWVSNKCITSTLDDSA
jgi:hypothetical protein